MVAEFAVWPNCNHGKIPTAPPSLDGEALMLGQRCDIILSAFTIHSLNWPHGPRSSPRGTGPIWRRFNSHRTLFTFRECSIIPFICCTERACDTKGVYSIGNNFRLANLFFYHLHCNSSNMSGKLGCACGLWLTWSSEISIHLLKRLSNLSCLKGPGIG